MYPITWPDDPNAFITSVNVFAATDDHTIHKIHLNYYKKSYPLIVNLHPLYYQSSSFLKSTYECIVGAWYSDTFGPVDPRYIEYVTQIEFINHKNTTDGKFYCTGIRMKGVRKGREITCEVNNEKKVTFPKGDTKIEKTKSLSSRTALTGLQLTINENEGTITFITDTFSTTLDNFKWGEWLNWSECDPLTGEKYRRRNCESGICDGESIEYLSCNQDGYFTEWSEWSECFLDNLKCGEGNQKRTREYVPPLYKGKQLEGPKEELRKCLIPCPETTTQELQTITKEQSVENVLPTQTSLPTQNTQQTLLPTQQQTSQEQISFPWWVFVLILIVVVVALVLLKKKLDKKVTPTQLNT